MYKQVNVRVLAPWVERLPDGVVKSLPIDQFVVSDKSLYKADGFPRTDVSILDRFNKMNVDPDLINQVAARMNELKADETMKDYSDEMKLKLLRPAWCQTATEMADFSERVYQVMEEYNQTLSKDEKQSVSELVENPSPSIDSVSSE